MSRYPAIANIDPPDPPARATAPRLRVSQRVPARGANIRFRVARIAAITTLLVLAASLLSFTSALRAPSNSPLGVRLVEWLRDNGAAGLVSEIEALYYSWHAPSTGGRALAKLPRIGVSPAGLSSRYAPSPIVPAIRPALPGEGTWHGTGLLIRGAPAVLVTTFRPDPDYPQMVAGVAWIDSSRAWLQLYPGRYEPAGGSAAGAQVPSQLRAGLLATFNSGFKLEDNGGGFVAFGHVYAPLKDGQATLVRYRDGTADVRTWTDGPSPAANVEFARQNLPLIVDGGRLNPNLSDGPQWGTTLGNTVRVWRSGVGVDARGNILYAAADEQTAISLAEILKRAGAVRAMELDINSDWVTFNFYGAWGAGRAQKLLPGMARDATRYLSPDDRDFLSVYARHG